MNVTVSVSDDLAAHFGSEVELGRCAVEALAVEEHRAGRSTRSELQHVLGFSTAPELDCFLDARGLAGTLAPKQSRGANDLRKVDDVVARFWAFAAAHALDGLDPKELILEGRQQTG